MVLPIGTPDAVLTLYEKGADGALQSRGLLDVRFVPMVEGADRNPSSSQGNK